MRTGSGGHGDGSWERQPGFRRPAGAFIRVALFVLLGVCPGGPVGLGRGADSGPRTPTARGDLWSLKPLVRPAVPPSGSAAVIRNPIDAFIVERLRAEGLEMSVEADRATLIRRLSFDLTGLPPTPAEVVAFVNDPSSRAYEELVGRLLDSPRYGERWARHWLDVVHFGETHGYDKDKMRPNAWPYRDYVIRAFNGDKPYGRFVEEQVAGDVLYPHTRDGIEALGFIAAGPWDFIGHEEVPETKIDGRVARHLDRDDMVVNTVQTFNSLTVQCAQCHDHKFDPISMEDYYSLQAVFAAVDRTQRKYDVDEGVSARRAELEERQRSLSERRRRVDERVVGRAGEAYRQLEKSIAEAEALVRKGEAYGYHSGISIQEADVKWVQVDLGRSLAFSQVVLHPCRDDFNGIGEGFGFPRQFRVEASDDPEFLAGVRHVGGSGTNDLPNPRLKAQRFDAPGLVARYVRVTATRLALRKDDFIFALAEVGVLTPAGTNLALGAVVTSLDSVEAPVRWQRSNLTDGGYPGAPTIESPGLVSLREQRERLKREATQPEDRAELEAVEAGLKPVVGALGALPSQRVVYAGGVHTGKGAFSGTGGNGGKPRVIRLLNRGNVEKGGREVSPGTLGCVDGLESRFELGPGHREGERRAALAKWLTWREHPLTWRSIVNRVWQYHFGRGIVETPNDFGRMGALPSHPALLDWLACEFRDGGQSLKELHRLMVTSAAYRQRSSGGNPSASRAAEMDSDNRLLWRQNRRKLEAEAVRDSVLFVSGRLDLRMGGPSFQDFVVEKPEHSPHYEYHLHDPEDPAGWRRSIYRFIVRSQQQPFMTTLDCADPSMQVSRRNESVSPLQALAMLNNALMIAHSRHLAARVMTSAADLDSQVEWAHQLALGRRPDADARAMLTGYAREFGLPNACRVLFNLNEFSFVD